MDIRIEKTQSAIREAFFQLRRQKPTERISVTELCRLAQINKSTFYSHYSDIFALSEVVESQAVEHILGSISQNLNYSSDNPEIFAREICMACISHLKLTDVLFSDPDSVRFSEKLEQSIKNLIYQKYPEYRNDISKNVLLSFCIQGAHHAFLNNREADPDTIVSFISEIIKTLRPLY